MKTISMAVNNRPQYLRRVLDSILAAAGHESWTLIFSAEPGCDEVQSMIRKVGAMNVIVSTNTAKMGCDVNTFLAAQIAHAHGSHFNLHLEDDMVISRDALLMCDWFRESSRERSIIALRRINESPPMSNLLTHSHDGLFGAGLGYHRSDFERHLRCWWLYYEQGMPGRGWDLSLPWMMNKHGYIQWRPLVNRSQHIGIFGGCHRLAGQTNPVMDDPCYDGLDTDFHYG